MRRLLRSGRFVRGGLVRAPAVKRERPDYLTPRLKWK